MSERGSLADVWHNHSLTIVLALFGLSFTLIAFTFEGANAWDFWLGFGQSLLGVALLFFLSRWFREIAKPEDPPPNKDDVEYYKYRPLYDDDGDEDDWPADPPTRRMIADAHAEADREGRLYLNADQHGGVPWDVRPNKDWLELHPWHRWMVDEQAAREKAGW